MPVDTDAVEDLARNTQNHVRGIWDIPAPSPKRQYTIQGVLYASIVPKQMCALAIQVNRMYGNNRYVTGSDKAGAVECRGVCY